MFQMSDENKTEMEEMLRINEKLFTGFLLLKGLMEVNKKVKVRNDLEYICENYAYLLSERKNYLEIEKKLKSLNGFYGLR